MNQETKEVISYFDEFTKGLSADIALMYRSMIHSFEDRIKELNVKLDPIVNKKEEE